MDTDLSALTSVVYYRLRLVDRDDTYTFSRVVQLKRVDAALMANVYPNPAQTADAVMIDSNVSLAGITLRTMLGTEIAVPITNKTNGKAELNLSEVANGLYLLEVKTTSGSIIKKLMIER